MPDHVNRPSTTPTAAGAQPPSLAFAARHHVAPTRVGAYRAGATSGEDGSLVSEYGLIAVLGATITGVAISWAKGGAIATLLNVILRQVRALAGV